MNEVEDSSSTKLHWFFCSVFSVLVEEDETNEFLGDA
jgi:hypothetical protein